MTRKTFDPTAVTHSFKPKEQAEKKPKGFNPTEFRQKQKTEKEKEKQQLIAVTELPIGPLKSWSFSALMVYENCPYASYLERVEKMSNGFTEASNRGNRIHAAAEQYIQGERDDLIKELQKFDGLLMKLRNEYAAGKVEVEGDWAVTRDWIATGWDAPDAWGRMKLDAIFFEDDTSVRIYDWKSGKKFGNEVKHTQQGLSYAIAVFARFPRVQFAQVSMVYTDQGEKITKDYTREEVETIHFTKFNHRVNLMTTATSFPPKPSWHSCKWCPHKKPQEDNDNPDKPACEWRHEDV